MCPDDPDLYAEAGEIAATKHALEKAIALFVKKNNLHLAAVSWVDLAEFYMEHQLLHNALDLLKGMQGNPLEHSPLSKNEIFSMEYSRISNK